MLAAAAAAFRPGVRVIGVPLEEDFALLPLSEQFSGEHAVSFLPLQEWGV